MKIDATQATQNVQSEQTFANDYRSLLVLNLLKKSVKEILADIEKNALTQEAPAKGKNGGQTAKAPPQPSMAKALSQALISSLEMDGTLKEISNAAIQQMLQYSLAQGESIQQLAQEIQNLENQLKNNLSQGQIAAIENELQNLESEYKQALDNYAASQSDYQKNKNAAANAQSDYEKLLEEYNKIQDKSSPEAQQIKKEMDADQAKEKAAQGAMANDQNQMNQDNSKISSVVSALQSLASSYPSLKNTLEILVNAVKARQSMNSEISQLMQSLESTAKEDQQICQQISAKEGQEQYLINSLAKSSNGVVEAVKNYLKNNQTAAEMILFQILSNFLSSVMQQQVNHNSKKDGKEDISQIELEGSSRTSLNPVYRDFHKKAEHQS